MKQLLKVWLVMGWTFNLFASENNAQFLALDVLNTPATKDLAAIMSNQTTSNKIKVDTFSIVVNGLTFTNDEGRDLAFWIWALAVLATAKDIPLADLEKSQIREIVKAICNQLNLIIKRLGVTHNFLPETSAVGLSARQIVPVIAFLHLIGGKERFFIEVGNETIRSGIEAINSEKIIQAYAP